MRRWAPLLLMVASGFAGLGYQIVWTQQCSSLLGHESAAVLAVVAAFFGGLALGGLIFGQRIERSARPVHWYAGCELTIAAWSALLFVFSSPFSAGVQTATGAEPSPVWQWSVAFFGTFLLLFPATAAMGATLPAMERLAVQMRRRGRSIAALLERRAAPRESTARARPCIRLSEIEFEIRNSGDRSPACQVAGCI
jgi:spermidine synthase